MDIKKGYLYLAIAAIYTVIVTILNLTEEQISEFETLSDKKRTEVIVVIERLHVGLEKDIVAFKEKIIV